MSDTVRIVFTPSGRRGEVEPGTPVLDAARRLGVDLDSACGGRGICGRCQVEVSEGDHAKHGIHSTAAGLGEPTRLERDYGGERPLKPGRRLGCVATVQANVVIDVPPESQLYRQVVRKEADAHPIVVDPVVRLHLVQVDEPDLGTSTSDLTRLREALEREWGLTGLSFDPHVVSALQRALRARPTAAGDTTTHGAGALDGDRRRTRGPGGDRRLARVSSTPPSGSPSTSARPPWPATSAICAPARCWPLPER